MSAKKLSARDFWLVAFAALIGAAHAPAARAADAVNVVTPSVVIFAIPYWIAERQSYFKDEGIDPARYEALSGRTLDPDRIATLKEHGFVESGSDGCLRVTPAGFPILDAVVADLAA